MGCKLQLLSTRILQTVWKFGRVKQATCTFQTSVNIFYFVYICRHMKYNLLGSPRRWRYFMIICMNHPCLFFLKVWFDRTTVWCGTYKAPLDDRNVHTCARSDYKVVHCSIFVWCIVGLLGRIGVKFLTGNKKYCDVFPLILGTISVK